MSIPTLFTRIFCLVSIIISSKLASLFPITESHWKSKAGFSFELTGSRYETTSAVDTISLVFVLRFTAVNISEIGKRKLSSKLLIASFLLIEDLKLLSICLFSNSPETKEFSLEARFSAKPSVNSSAPTKFRGCRVISSSWTGGLKM